MIYLLHGGDEFSLNEVLASMKEDLEPAELRDVNIATLDGAHVSLGELIAVCDTVPFLAEKRMVIVRGLLAKFEARAPARGGTRGTPSQDRGRGPWEGLPEYLPRMSQTTELVFVEERLSEANPLLATLRPLVEVRTFPLPAGNALRQWIRQRAASQGIDMEPRAVDTLAETIGSNLRIIDLELRKLSLFRWGGVIRHEDVQELVAYAKEANIFAAVDAVLEGRAGVAVRLAHQLLDSGRAPSHLLTMIARQVRFLLLAKDLKAQGVASSEMGRRLSLSGFPLRKTLEQEGRFTHERLAHIHHKLLEADISIKTGELDDGLALDVLIAEVASAPPRS